MLPTEFLPQRMALVMDDLFEPDVLTAVVEHVLDGGWNYGWKSNKKLEEGFGHFNKSFVVAGAKSRRDVSEEMPSVVRPVWDRLAATVLVGYVPVRCYANLHVHGIEGYPHTDSHEESDLTAVVYLNPEWHRDWGGETILFDDDGNATQAVTPRYGRVVLLASAKYHKAAPVSRICAAARVCLVFKARVAG